MNSNLLFLLSILAVIIYCVNCQCCDQRCRVHGSTLDCDGVCKEERLCKIGKYITKLNFRNNSLGIRSNVQFPFHSKLKRLNIGYNEFTSIIPSAIFTSFQNLEVISLEGNQFNLASFYVPVQHGLKIIVGLTINCLHTNYLSNLFQLQEIEVTLTDMFCKEILLSSLNKITITLKGINELSGDNFDKLGKMRSIKLNLPNVQTIKANDFKHFSEIRELTLVAPLLSNIEGNILKKMKKLTKFRISCPKLRLLNSEILKFRDGNEPSKLEHIEICPARHLPNDLFTMQPALTSIYLCGFSENTYIGIPSENRFNKITLSNSKFRTRSGSIHSIHDFTVYALIDGKPTLDPNIKIQTQALALINMSLHNNDWSTKFNTAQIKYLDLSDNELTAIDAQNENLNKLEQLNLANNKITYISHQAFAALNALRSLDISNNLLESLDLSIFNTGHLWSLDCSQNQISTVKPDARGMNIVKFKLSNNKIESINDLFESGNNLIRSLAITDNLITQIPHQFPKSLQRLFLTNNPINCSCDSINHLNDLSEKLVENNQMSVIRSLRYVTCDNQTLKVLDQAQICANITKAEDNQDIQIDFQVQKSDVIDRFIPAFGVLIKDFAKITSGNNLITANFQIVFPKIHVPKIIDISQIKRICSGANEEFKRISEDIIKGIEVRYSELRDMRFKVYDKLISIHKIAYDDRVIHRSRKKRFILQGIKTLSHIALNVAKIYSESVTRKQVKAMGKAVEIIQSKVLTNSKQILTIKEEMALYQSQNLKQFSRVENEINLLRNQTIEIAQQVTHSIELLIREHDQRVKKLSFFALANIVGDHINNKITDNFRVYDNMLTQMNNLLLTISQLKQGILSPVMFPPELIQKVLDNARTLLSEELPEYKLVFDNVNEYYSLRNIAFSIDKHLGIIAQIPIFLTLKSLDFLKLYHLNAIKLPVDENKRTQLVLEHNYLGATNDFYVTFTNEQFQLCKSHVEQKIFICPYDLILRNRNTKKTCESAVFYNESVNSVYNHCSIHLFPEEVHHTPEMLQFDDKIILTDIHEPVTWNCADSVTKKQNNTIMNLNYIIIEKDALCGCDLKTKEFFIPRKSCSQNSENGKLHYVINALAYVALKDYMNQNVSEEALMSIYDSYPNISFPEIDLTLLEKKDPLFRLEHDFALDLKHTVETLSEDHEVHVITENDLNSFYQLFAGKSKIIGYTLIIAITSCLGIVIMLIICKRQRLLKNLIYAMIAREIPLGDANKLIVINNFEEYIISTVLMFVSMLILNLLLTISKKLIHKIVHHVPTLEVPKILKHSDHVTLYLILRTVDSKISIPVCNIPSQIDMIQLENGFGVDSLFVTRSGLSYTLHVKWSTDRSNLIIEDQKIKIPSRISIRIWQALKIRKIRESDMLMSLILINERNLAYKLAQFLHTPCDYEMEAFSIQTKENSKALLKMKKNLLLKESF